MISIRAALASAAIALLVPAFAPARANTTASPDAAGQDAAPPRELEEPDTHLPFPERTSADDHAFHCIGVGARKLMFLKVYAIAFCIGSNEAIPTMQSAATAASKNGKPLTVADALEHDDTFFEAIVKAHVPKLAVIRLVRDVNAARLATAFKDGLSQSLSPEKLEKLVRIVPGDAHKDDVIRILTTGDEVTMDIAGKRNSLHDEDIAREVWRVWLGTQSVSPSLQRSIAQYTAAALSG